MFWLGNLVQIISKHYFLPCITLLVNTTNISLAVPSLILLLIVIFLYLQRMVSKYILEKQYILIVIMDEYNFNLKVIFKSCWSRLLKENDCAYF